MGTARDRDAESLQREHDVDQNAPYREPHRPCRHGDGIELGSEAQSGVEQDVDLQRIREARASSSARREGSTASSAVAKPPRALCRHKFGVDVGYTPPPRS
jgi:hypothetical protein